MCDCVYVCACVCVCLCVFVCVCVKGGQWKEERKEIKQRISNVFPILYHRKHRFFLARGNIHSESLKLKKKNDVRNLESILPSGELEEWRKEKGENWNYGAG